MPTPQPEFENDVAGRTYRYVERHGSATHEEVRNAIEVPVAVESKPARSGTRPSSHLPVGEFNDQVTTLTEAGYLRERDGRLYVAPDAEAETHDAEEFEYVVRPADEDDRESIAALIREVADEGALVVDERVADAVDGDEALVRLNDRESRMFFVPEIEGEDGESEIVGWVHVRRVGLPARDHTAELTVGVAPEYRGRGVGGTLLERGMAWADEEDCIKVYQSLPATNEGALGMLDAHGWEREATRADHYEIDGELVDEVQLAKRLDE